METQDFDRFVRGLAAKPRRHAFRLVAGIAFGAAGARPGSAAVRENQGGDGSAGSISANGCARPNQKCDKDSECCTGTTCKGGKCRCKGNGKPCRDGCCPAGTKCVAGFCARAFGTPQGPFDQPLGVTVDRDGVIYVADAGNDRIVKLDQDGRILDLLTGNGQVSAPQDVAVDAAGRIWVVNVVGQSGALLRLRANGSPDGNFPIGGIAIGVAIDDERGFVWVVQINQHQVRRLSLDGNLQAGFGNLGSGNGQFRFPSGIAVAGDGTLYVADSNNFRIQRFSPTSQFLGAFGSQGSGPGEFEGGTDVAVDTAGFVYVADPGNGRVQKFTAEGEFVRAFGQVGTGLGQFNAADGIAVDRFGAVHVAERSNNRLQRFDPV